MTLLNNTAMKATPTFKRVKVCNNTLRQSIFCEYFSYLDDLYILMITHGVLHKNTQPYRFLSNLNHAFGNYREKSKILV